MEFEFCSHDIEEIETPRLRPEVIKLPFEAPLYKDIEKVYGIPGDPKNLVRVKLPFPFRIAWNLKQTV